jgi:uncharacterized membrane protein
VGNRWNTTRIEAFSDGVFAIAITLLILEIKVPETEFADLWRAIADQWPSYLGYVTSFLTIGGIWMAHHGLFRRLEYANNTIMRLNLLLLMVVSFLPFPTGLVAHAISDAGAERAAVMFYGTTLLVISLLLYALWAAAARDRGLLKADVSEGEIEKILSAASPNIGAYVGVVLLALVAPRVAAFGLLVIAFAMVLRANGDYAPDAATEAEPG